jgi:hypothetical protein
MTDLHHYMSAAKQFRDEAHRLRERCVQLEAAFECIETKVRAIFAEAERLNFDDSTIYLTLYEVKTAVLNAIRRG